MIGKSDALIKCPNVACQTVMEVIQKTRDKIVGDLIAQKKDASSEAEIHREQYRVRCRSCNLEFCSKCLVTPYHENFTCEQVCVHLYFLLTLIIQ